MNRLEKGKLCSLLSPGRSTSLSSPYMNAIVLRFTPRAGRHSCSTMLRSAVFAIVAGGIAGSAAAAEQHHFLNYQTNRIAQPQSVTVTDFAGWFTASGPSVGTGAAEGSMLVGGESTFGSALALASGSGAGYYGYMWAYWEDVVIYSGGAPGSIGTVSMDLTFDWTHSLDAAQGGVGTAHPFFDVNLLESNGVGGFQHFQYAVVEETHTRDCTGPSCVDSSVPSTRYDPRNSPYAAPNPTVNGNMATMYFQVVFGKEYRKLVGINAMVSGAESTTTVDASHSLHWAGISSVVDADGNPVNFTVHSASGFNYVTGVPEPSQLGMFLLGLGAIGLVMKVARTQRRC